MDTVKILPYSPAYRAEVNDFVDRCMHELLGRPRQNRPDLMHVEEYYLARGGGFWCAVTQSGRVVGTIALENQGETGIMKRFYVAGAYQSAGLGSRLHAVFDAYVREQTHINMLYLSCDKGLEKAHRFYAKHGYRLAPPKEVGVHVAPNDDFFEKEIRR